MNQKYNFMKNFRLSIIILASKLAIKLCRIAKHGGTTLPGKVALKLYPGFLKSVSARCKIIMVTGTNGKTTTARIIGQILKENNIEFITNKSGANLVSGVATTFIGNISVSGRLCAPTALIEIDEAAFKVISKHLSPDILVVTNFFRDQLDRYGELYSTLNSVKSGIANCPRTHLILNADDSLCSSLGLNVPNEVLYYGFKEGAYNGGAESINSDAMFCIFCKSRYEYTSHTYGHLGAFKCTQCGYHNPVATVTCTEVSELTSAHSIISLKLDSGINTARVNLPGLYNIYNALAAAACGELMKLPASATVKALDSFECGFGRMETIQANGRIIKVILVKNPTGFNQVLNFLSTESKQMHIAFLINDKIADGTDISWLWDVEFEKMTAYENNIGSIVSSGVRAEEMAVRLKYAGLDIGKINIEKDYKRLIGSMLEKVPDGCCMYILPTYTAMLEIRQVLKNMFGLKDFWR